MKRIEHVYIDGRFVEPHGRERADLFNPATEAKIGEVRLGDAQDVQVAVEAAVRCFPAMRATPPAERIALLLRLRDAVATRTRDMLLATSEEYGAPRRFSDFAIPNAAASFESMARVLEGFAFTRTIGTAKVTLQPVGVAAAITPWNSDVGFICAKLAAAIAAGTTLVIKPSELSAMQTQLVCEAIHDAGLPPGAFNMINGYGHVVGSALSRHPAIAKLTFTGSTATGRAILGAAAETFKRVTLELGGKGPQILLDDADLDAAIPALVMSGLMNSGQACIAGTRLLVPEHRLRDVEVRLKAFMESVRVGPASDPEAQVGPLVSRGQWERVQGYIRLGQEEGATLLTGGEGRPDHLERGWFVRPTLFTGVHNGMRIAREEIFGPVLCVIPYRDEDDAIAIANDSDYGLQAYVLGTDLVHARRVADRLDVGRVVVNAAPHEPLAPFGGFKHSGIGREFGTFGLEAFLEPRAVLG